MATFSKIKSRGVDFRVSMVTAKHESDFNYITFSDSRVNNSRFDVGGRRADETGMMAFLYGDRTIYRPGETIHLNTIVRTEQWQNVSGVPVKVTLLMPNGREFKTIRGTLNNDPVGDVVELEEVERGRRGKFLAPTMYCLLQNISALRNSFRIVLM